MFKSFAEFLISVTTFSFLALYIPMSYFLGAAAPGSGPGPGPGPAASPRRAPSLRLPSSASGPGVGSRSGAGGRGTRGAEQLRRARAGATGGGGVRDAEAPAVESPVLRTGLIDYFLLKDPTGGGAT